MAALCAPTYWKPRFFAKIISLEAWATTYSLSGYYSILEESGQRAILGGDGPDDSLRVSTQIFKISCTCPGTDNPAAVGWPPPTPPSFFPMGIERSLAKWTPVLLWKSSVALMFTRTLSLDSPATKAT